VNSYREMLTKSPREEEYVLFKNLTRELPSKPVRPSHVALEDLATLKSGQLQLSVSCSNFPCSVDSMSDDFAKAVGVTLGRDGNLYAHAEKDMSAQPSRSITFRVEGLVHNAPYAVWVAPLGSFGELGPWSHIAGHTKAQNSAPLAPKAPTSGVPANCSTVTIELPPPVVGCDAPESYRLDTRLAGELNWESKVDDIIQAETVEVLHPVGKRLVRAGRGVQINCERNSALEARLTAFNRLGSSPASASSGLFVCGTKSMFFKSPPVIRVLSSASFAISWAADEQSIACVDGIRWDVLYQRVAMNSDDSADDPSDTQDFLSSRGNSDQNFLDSRDDTDVQKWHLLVGSRVANALHIEPFRCSGCSFKVRAHLPLAGAPVIESLPSAPVSSKRLADIAPDSARFELSLRPDETWSEPRFVSQLAALLALNDDQFAVVETRIGVTTGDSMMATEDSSTGVALSEVVDWRTRPIVKVIVEVASSKVLGGSDIEETPVALARLMQTNSSWMSTLSEYDDVDQIEKIVRSSGVRAFMSSTESPRLVRMSSPLPSIGEKALARSIALARNAGQAAASATAKLADTVSLEWHALGEEARSASTGAGEHSKLLALAGGRSGIAAQTVLELLELMGLPVDLQTGFAILLGLIVLLMICCLRVACYCFCRRNIRIGRPARRLPFNSRSCHAEWCAVPQSDRDCLHEASAFYDHGDPFTHPSHCRGAYE